jgi:hypothetical protein
VTTQESGQRTRIDTTQITRCHQVGKASRKPPEDRIRPRAVRGPARPGPRLPGPTGHLPRDPASALTGSNRGRLALAVHDRGGAIIGFCGRAIGPPARRLHSGCGDPFGIKAKEEGIERLRAELATAQQTVESVRGEHKVSKEVLTFERGTAVSPEDAARAKKAEAERDALREVLGAIVKKG